MVHNTCACAERAPKLIVAAIVYKKLILTGRARVARRVGENMNVLGLVLFFWTAVLRTDALNRDLCKLLSSRA